MTLTMNLEASNEYLVRFGRVYFCCLTCWTSKVVNYCNHALLLPAFACKLAYSTTVVQNAVAHSVQACSWAVGNLVTDGLFWHVAQMIIIGVCATTKPFHLAMIAIGLKGLPETTLA